MIIKPNEFANVNEQKIATMDELDKPDDKDKHPLTRGFRSKFNW